LSQPDNSPRNHQQRTVFWNSTASDLLQTFSINARRSKKYVTSAGET